MLSVIMILLAKYLVHTGPQKINSVYSTLFFTIIIRSWANYLFGSNYKNRTSNKRSDYADQTVDYQSCNKRQYRFHNITSFHRWNILYHIYNIHKSNLLLALVRNTIFLFDNYNIGRSILTLSINKSIWYTDIFFFNIASNTAVTPVKQMLTSSATDSIGDCFFIIRK